MRQTAIRSIRAFCVDCIGGAAYVEECTALTCQLYPFRMGKNPNISEASKEKSRQRMLIRLAEKSGEFAEGRRDNESGAVRLE